MAKILVVDDSQTLRMQLRKMLEEAKHEVIEAEDGLHGFELMQAAKGEFELVLCDVNMPRMDGLTMCEKVREGGLYKGPIFMVTTESNPDMKTRGKAAGVVAWITKPFTTAKVISGVEKVLARKDEAA